VPAGRPIETPQRPSVLRRGGVHKEWSTLAFHSLVARLFDLSDRQRLELGPVRKLLLVLGQYLCLHGVLWECLLLRRVRIVIERHYGHCVPFKIDLVPDQDLRLPAGQGWAIHLVQS
jgi:hypothetical protein